MTKNQQIIADSCILLYNLVWAIQNIIAATYRTLRRYGGSGRAHAQQFASMRVVHNNNNSWAAAPQARKLGDRPVGGSVGRLVSQSAAQQRVGLSSAQPTCHPIFLPTHN